MEAPTTGSAESALKRALRLGPPDWRRVLVILAGGLVGVLATSVLIPRQVANASPTVAARPNPGSPQSPARHWVKNTVTPAPAPTSTTLPPAPRTPTPSPAPPNDTTPSPPAPAPVAPPAPPVTTHGVLPPQNPPSNIAPQPDFLQSCSGSQYDDSTGCVNAALQAIANARQAEGLGPMSLPGDWYSLTPPEQLYEATNLERVARGLQPMQGMVGQLDQASDNAASSNTDPQPPSGFGYVQWGSNWAGAVGNPLEAIYFWMYDDGPGSSNIDCTSTNTSGCWGHRDNVLLAISGSDLYMGTGYVSNAYQGAPSWTELLVKATQSWPVDFS